MSHREALCLPYMIEYQEGMRKPTLGVISIAPNGVYHVSDGLVEETCRVISVVSSSIVTHHLVR